MPIPTDEAYTLTQHAEYPSLEPTAAVDENGVPMPAQVTKRRARVRDWFFRANLAKPSADEIAAAHSHGDEAHEVEASDEHKAVSQH
jgi:ubiquinol-cytochrome c reductase cytochrome b subunit